MLPVIVVNAKTYPESTASDAQRLGTACAAIAHEATVLLALQPFDLYVQIPKVKMLAQHLDACEPGRNTGFLVPANAKRHGVVGTLLNHSEHKLPFDVLTKTVAACRKEGLLVILCADTPEEAARVATLAPDYVAVEPPELIGGNVSVSTARPDVITAALAAVGNVPLLVGAGIKNGADVKKSLELGAIGVLVASGVVLAKDPRKVLEGFVA